MQESPIKLFPEDSRLTTFPIFRKDIWQWYETAYRSFWITEEVSLSRDIADFEGLSSKEQKFIKHILAFFAASDGIVNINLAERFRQEITILEAKYFYDFQIMMENVHAQMYSILLDTLISDTREKEQLLNSVKTIPVIEKMAAYMFECINSQAMFAERLLKMACVEGIFFAGCFCAIYWLQNKGKMPGLAHSNELIARDEGLHTMFALFMYKKIILAQTPSPDRVKKIMIEAVDIAKEFICDALPYELAEMNSNLMSKYIESRADDIMTLVDGDAIYGSPNPFHFMENINLQNKTNFFERRVSEYSKTSISDKSEFDTNFDF